MARKTRRVLKRLGGGVVFLAVLYLVASPFVVPMIAQRFVSDFDDELSVRFGSALFHPLTFDLLVDDLELLGPDKTVLAQIPSARLPLDVSDLLAGTGTFTSESLNARWRNEDQQVVVTLSDIAPALIAPFGKTLGIEIAAGRFSAQINAPIEEGPITGSISVRDLQARSTDMQTDFSLKALTLDSVEFDPEAQTLTVEDVTIASLRARNEDAPAALNAEAVTLDSATFDLDAQTLTTKDVAITSLEVRSGDAPEALNAEVVTLDSATYDLDAQTLTTKDIAITSLEVRSGDAPVAFNAGTLTLNSATFDTDAQTLNVGRVVLTNPLLDNIALPTPGLIARSRAEKRAAELQIAVDGIDVINAEINMLGHGPDAMPVQITTPTMTLSDLRYGTDWSGTLEAAGMVSIGDTGNPGGTTSPFTLAAQVDSAEAATGQISLVVDRLDHAVLSPGLFTLLGRASAAGTFYADLEASSTNGDLDGSLSLLFDQWEWGDLNPDYSGEPIPLRKAFNILRGRGGRVRMSLPLEGNLDEPTFRGDAVVRRATNRAIGDIVGAPFKLLGALIPGGGKSDLELNKIEFDAGSAELTPLDRSKLSALAVALIERPSLQLEIQGAASEKLDFPNTVAQPGELAALSTKRADAVKVYLIVAGVDEARLSTTINTTSTENGKGKPVVRLTIIS